MGPTSIQESRPENEEKTQDQLKRQSQISIYIKPNILLIDESQKGEDVWSLEFKKLFEKAAKKVERMLRIKSLAEGRSV